MKSHRDPVKIGIGIFLLILAAIVVIVAVYWDTLSPRQRATVGIGGIGAIGTASLALATFWTIRQNEKTLRNLERERKKPTVLDIIAEVIDPIITSTKTARESLTGAQEIWRVNSRGGDHNRISISRPPSRHRVEISIWHEFKQDYSDLFSECEEWWEKVNELGDTAEELATALYEADEYENISDRSRAVRAIMNGTKFSEGAEKPVDNVEEYRREMYVNYPELHHQYWRKQWELLKLIQDLQSDTIEMKRDLQSKYGISNQEIVEHQNKS